MNGAMKKKLLFFHHCGTVGGAGISGLNFLNCVPKENYEIIIYTVSNPEGMATLYNEKGYTVCKSGADPVAFTHCVGSEKFALSPRALLNYYKVSRSKKSVEQIIVREKPDVVVANSMTLFWIGKIAKKYNAQTICFFRETYIEGLFGIRTKHIKNNLSKYFDKIAFISNYELVRSAEIKSQKMTIYNMVQPDGYDRYTQEEARDSLGLPKDNFYILYVGGFNELKGAKVLLEAMSLIQNTNIKVLFVGGDLNDIAPKKNEGNTLKRIKNCFIKSYNTKCAQLINKYQLQDKVIFFKNQKDISRFYCAANALVFPMIKPHQARPIFEAGYAKIPVIVTNFENIKELADESTCFLFKNKDYKDLATKIEYVYNHPEEGTAKVLKNYENTLKRHGPQTYKEQIDLLLKDS